MIRPPPTSTLFPYTTLFRSRRHPQAARSTRERNTRSADADSFGDSDRGDREVRTARSEEHTSELQSLTNLVCRLLLEKKKLRDDSDSLRKHDYNLILKLLNN